MPADAPRHPLLHGLVVPLLALGPAVGAPRHDRARGPLGLALPAPLPPGAPAAGLADAANATNAAKHTKMGRSPGLPSTNEGRGIGAGGRNDVSCMRRPVSPPPTPPRRMVTFPAFHAHPLFPPARQAQQCMVIRHESPAHATCRIMAKPCASLSAWATHHCPGCHRLGTARGARKGAAAPTASPTWRVRLGAPRVCGPWRPHSPARAAVRCRPAEGGGCGGLRDVGTGGQCGSI